MKFNRLNAISILLLFPLPIYANNGSNEYHFETQLAYDRVVDDSIESDSWRINSQYYWNPIIYSQLYPNKEATFINRLGSIGVQYKGDLASDYRSEILFTELDASFTYAEKEFNHVFQLDYGWETISSFEIGDFDFETNTDSHKFKLGYEYYLLDNLTIGANFSARFFKNIFFEKETYTYNIRSKYLINIGNKNWLSLIGSYHYQESDGNFREDSSHNISAIAEYYFTPITSLQLSGGASFIDRVGFSSETQFVNIALYHFFTEQFAAVVGAGNQFNFFDNRQKYSVGFNYRF